jgi:hypothetical protein
MASKLASIFPGAPAALLSFFSLVTPFSNAGNAAALEIADADKCNVTLSVNWNETRDKNYWDVVASIENSAREAGIPLRVVTYPTNGVSSAHTFVRGMRSNDYPLAELPQACAEAIKSCSSGGAQTTSAPVSHQTPEPSQ